MGILKKGAGKGGWKKAGKRLPPRSGVQTQLDTKNGKKAKDQPGGNFSFKLLKPKLKPQKTTTFGTFCRRFGALRITIGSVRLRRAGNLPLMEGRGFCSLLRLPKSGFEMLWDLHHTFGWFPMKGGRVLAEQTFGILHWFSSGWFWDHSKNPGGSAVVTQTDPLHDSRTPGQLKPVRNYFLQPLCGTVAGIL